MKLLIKIEQPMNAEFTQRVVASVVSAEAIRRDDIQREYLRGELMLALQGQFDIGCGGSHVWIADRHDGQRIAIIEQR